MELNYCLGIWSRGIFMLDVIFMIGLEINIIRLFFFI